MQIVPLVAKPGARTARPRGFTLIEVLIVLAIILALSGLVGVAVFAQRDQAKINLTKTDLNTIKNAIRLFELNYDRFPTDEEGLAVLWDKSVLDPEADAAQWTQCLNEAMPNDRWGQAWGYRSESDVEGMYELWSNGPDKEEGTDDDLRPAGAASADSESSAEGGAPTGGGS